MEHVARVRDIELLTGITFFPGFQSGEESKIRFRLRLPQFTSQWIYDFLYTVPPTSDIFTPGFSTTKGFEPDATSRNDAFPTNSNAVVEPTTSSASSFHANFILLSIFMSFSLLFS